MKIAFRVDGSQILGMGNIYRSLIVADSLHKNNQEICFIMKNFPGSYDSVLEHGYPVFLINQDACNGTLNAQIHEIIENNNINLIINDVKNTDTCYMNHLKDMGLIVVNFDDLGSGRNKADILIDAFLPSINVGQINHHNFGPEFIILRDEFIKYRKQNRLIRDEVKEISVMMGASNAGKLLETTIRALSEIPNSIHCNIVMSRAVPNAELFQIEYPNNNFTYHYHPENIAELLFNSDISITGGGISMCESCAVGTPTIVLPQVPHEETNAMMFESAGAVTALKYSENTSKEQILLKLNGLIKNTPNRIMIAHNARKFIDGKGISRIVEILKPYLN